MEFSTWGFTQQQRTREEELGHNSRERKDRVGLGASTVTTPALPGNYNPSAAFLTYLSVIYDFKIGRKGRRGLQVTALRINADVAMNPMKYVSGNQWQRAAVASNQLSVLPNRCCLQPHLLLGREMDRERWFSWQHVCL